jgi:hypothetical protein
VSKPAGIFALIALFGWFAGASCSRAVECSGQIVDGQCVSRGLDAGPANDASDASDASDADAASAGEPCSATSDCDTAHGLACVGGTCRVSCRSHFDCAAVGECEPGADSAGTPGNFCAPTGAAPRGQFYTACPFGNECDTAHGFSCIGSGVGDLDAYCTRDCANDTDCADGFYCGEIRRTPCTDACGLKGNNLDPTCVPADQIGSGQPYACGPFGATRRLCREREFCSSCTQDTDCMALPNGVCAKDQSGASICTQLCDLAHPSCPWGTAATCGRWPGNSAPTCAHRFGSCVGTGKGCEPCVRSTDCGSAGLCTSSTFSGEHWCIDLSVTCSCDGLPVSNGLCSGGGCPTSPGGLEMICISDSQSLLDGACYGANTAQNLLIASQQTGCWPAR